MRILILFFFLFGSEITLAQSSQKCISLEGIHLGCVPSENHACIRLVVKNKEEITPDNPTGSSTGNPFTCQYIKIIQTERRNPQTGPLPLNCQSWKPGFNPNAGGETGIDRNSMCDIFSQPVCDEVCKLCVPELKTANVDTIEKGCEILSDGSGSCTGDCRNRCSDEPYSGGIFYGTCGGPRVCLAAGENVACRTQIPVCPGTFPGNPGFPGLGVPPSPADPTFLNTKDYYPVCSNAEKCPRAVDYHGNAVDELPGGGFPQCITSSGAPVQRVNGSCPCVMNGSPVARGENGFCPQGAQDSTPVTMVNVGTSGQCPEIPPIVPSQPSQGASCPWVKAFGKVRRDCEPVPCCCQFDPVTKKAKTSEKCVAEGQGACPGGCEGWIDTNIPPTSGTATATANSTSVTTKKASSKRKKK